MKKERIQELRKRLKLSQKTAVFLLCLLLSTIFWVFTSLSKEYETEISIPVTYRNIPFTKYFDSDLPAKLSYHFKGTGFRLARVHFRSRPDSIHVDVAAFSNSSNELHLQTILLRNQFPGDQKPYKITPESIRTGFNSRVSRKVPIRLVANISYRHGFESIRQIQIIPDSVELAGPPGLLAKITEVRTKELVLQNISSNQQGTISLDSSSYMSLTSSRTQINYSLPVEEFTEGVMELPVELPVSQKNRVLVIPQTVKVTYVASLSDFAMVKPTDFRIEAEVPFSQLPSKLAVVVRKQPLSVRILSINPDFLEYLVQK